MPFSRSRRPPIAGDPHSNLHHHHHYHYRFNMPDTAAAAAAAATTSSQYSGCSNSRKQNRDRTFVDPDAGPAAAPPLKRRRPDESSRLEAEAEDSRRQRRGDDASRMPLEVEEATAAAAAAAADFMSRAEIERCSPSRKDGIDALTETHLRYSYCSYLQSLGMRLELPQTTIGTAMVLCHRFFVHRSHASHDRFLIATAALFLSAKSEETSCLLNTVLRASCEVCQKQNFAFFPYLIYSHDWFDQYREQVIEAEQMILATLDFELDVHHPYAPLTTVLSKLGLSQTVLLNLAWNLVSEGLRSSLWLQFKPQHIAAGATFLAARFLNFDLSYYQNIWHEFKTTPSILQDVAQQLMELF